MDNSADHKLPDMRKKTAWYLGYSVVALSFIFIAQGNTFAQCLRIRSFYSDIVFAFITTFAGAVYIHKLNQYLNRTYPLPSSPRPRLTRQIMLGILVPAISAMALETEYLHLIGIPFAQSSILNLELPLSVLFLTIINLIYISTEMYRSKQVTPAGTDEEVPATATRGPSGHIIVQTGAREEAIPIEECAYMYTSNKLVWLQTFSGQQYRVLGTLEQWEEKLNVFGYFRINRQFLSSRKAVVSTEQTETRKLRVHFVFPCQEAVYVSKLNVACFRHWWKKSGPF